MKVEIDNSEEIFGSKTSIADLAQFHESISNSWNYDLDTDIFNIKVYQRMVEEYVSELKEHSMHKCERFVLTFKDGSKLTVTRLEK
ncbi:hypothetical protein PP940_gp161 [Rhizobium phage RL2RES]|uniref:Uncharacterized protein n=1 Tax=Rhizobium phage RL2RES TaxID=103371 RepID=A0A6B9J221_9CAUD|nr:hypothetical protein PP940_gp161 [Rhizobium phage RL2RES]QGZ14290.1 hypothetical protein RL2RES_161 [Rhizobium phage RL2RES]